MLAASENKEGYTLLIELIPVGVLYNLAFANSLPQELADYAVRDIFVDSDRPKIKNVEDSNQPEIKNIDDSNQPKIKNIDDLCRLLPFIRQTPSKDPQPKEPNYSTFSVR